MNDATARVLGAKRALREALKLVHLAETQARNTEDDSISPEMLMLARQRMMEADAWLGRAIE